MKSYRALNYLIFLVIVAYITTGYVSFYTGAGEIYPIWSWDLFSTVPQPHQTDYALRFLEIEGDFLPTPVYFEQANHWISITESIDAHAVILAIAQAIIADNEPEVSRLRKLLEAQYLYEVQSGHYEIVQRQYDLRERWLTGEFQAEASIGSFAWEWGQ